MCIFLYFFFRFFFTFLAFFGRQGGGYLSALRNILERLLTTLPDPEVSIRIPPRFNLHDVIADLVTLSNRNQQFFITQQKFVWYDHKEFSAYGMTTTTFPDPAVRIWIPSRFNLHHVITDLITLSNRNQQFFITQQKFVWYDHKEFSAYGMTIKNFRLMV